MWCQNAWPRVKLGVGVSLAEKNRISIGKIIDEFSKIWVRDTPRRMASRNRISRAGTLDVSVSFWASSFVLGLGGREMIPQILAQIQKLERRLDDVSNRVQAILDEGFGPEPVDALENNLDLLEKKTHEARADRERILLERDEAREKATRAWEENLRLDAENRRIERERDSARAIHQDQVDLIYQMNKKYELKLERWNCRLLTSMRCRCGRWIARGSLGSWRRMCAACWESRITAMR